MRRREQLPIPEPPPLSLGVNFDAPGAEDDLAAGDAAGMTAAAHWNRLPPKNGSVRELRLSNGEATGATLTLSGIADGNLAADFTPVDAHQKLLHGRFDFSTEKGEYPVIEVDRLPGELVASGYDVVLYTYRPPDSRAKFCAAYAVNGARRIGFPATTLPEAGAWRETPHGATGHAIVFRGLSGDRFTLQAVDPPGYGQGSICALQIVARRPGERRPLVLPLSRVADDDAGSWVHGDGTPAATEPSWIPGGGQCVHFQGTEEKPHFSLSLVMPQGPNGLVEPIDARGFERLAFRVRNPDPDDKAHVSLMVAFEGGERGVRESVYLAPGESREVTADLSARGLRKRSDRIVGISAIGTGAVLLDDLELIAEPLARLRPVQREMAALRRALDGKWSGISAHASPELKRRREEFDALEERVADLAARIETGTIGWAEAYGEVGGRDQGAGVTSQVEETVMEAWGRVRVLAAAMHALKDEAAPFVLASQDALTRVFLEAHRIAPASLGRTLELKAARNEAESGQVTIVPLAADLADVTWTVAPLAGPSGRTIRVDVELLGYVYCLNNMFGDTEGWWPDPLIAGSDSIETVPLGETATLWLTATVPDDAPAGVYRGAVTISAQTAGSRTLPVELEVYDFAIPPPERTSLQTLFWEREESRYLEPLLKNYRIDAGLMDHEKDWSADDMRQAGQWGKQRFRIGHLHGVEGPPYLDPRLDRKLPLFGRRLARAEAAGVRERCYLYAYDEAGHPAHGASHKHEPEALFNSAKRVHLSYPDLPVMSCPLIFDASAPTVDMRDGVRDLDILVAWIKNYHNAAGKMEQARRWGYEMWCYTCLGVAPEQGNIYIDSNTPADLRSMMGSQAFREGCAACSIGA